MRLRDDERGASVQVGAILLFGFMIVAIATWQATVVPQDNARVEFTHNQRVQDDMQDVRNAIVSAPGSTSIASVGVDMAPEYPPRTIFVNPGPPSGTLRTVGTDNESLNLTVTNAVAADDETDDHWDGTNERFNTGGLAYEPNYNVFTKAPTSVYETTVLYHAFKDGTVVNGTGQAVVDGRTIRLVVLNGSLSRTTSDTYSIDMEALSSSTNRVAITDDGDAITISFASRRPPGWWNASFDDTDELDEDGGHVIDVRSGSPATIGPYYNVTVELEAGVTYQLQMAKVGVGSGTTAPGKHYVIDVDGDGTTVGTGNTQQLVVEVRDRYNNPVSGVTVRKNDTGSNLLGGSLDATEKTTGSDGQVTFEYDATGASTGTATIQFNISDDVTPLGRELVNFSVLVTSSGGSGDTTGPSTTNVDTNPSGPYTQGDTFNLSGKVSDVLRGGTQIIAAEWYNNSTGDPGEGNANPMTATDGSFDTVEETVEDTVDTSGWPAGDYELYVRGQDANGNWGPVTSTVITVQAGAGPGPTVDSLSISEDDSGNDPHADFLVSWQVSDSTGDLDSVQLTLYQLDSNGNRIETEDSVTNAVSGGSASGTDSLRANQDDNNGETYEVELIVTDLAGNTDSANATEVENGT